MENRIECATLRQALQQVNAELQYLTNDDVQQCKFKTRQKIFSTLFSMLDAQLGEINVKIQHLQDVRELELKRQRLGDVTRDVKVESEMVFRSRFCSIVLQGLETLRWPPTLEPFANPLNDLISDASTFKDAVQFILNFLPSSMSLLSPRAQSRSSDCPLQSSHSDASMSLSFASARSSAQAGVGIYQSRPTSAASELTDSPSPDYEAQKKNHARPLAAASSKSSRPPSSSLLTARSIASATSIQSNRTAATPSMHSFTSHHPSGVRSTPKGVGFDDSDFDVQSMSAHSTNTAAPQPSEPVTQSIEILQYHNEVLSRQLKQLQEHVCQRDHAEARMDSILVDLQNAVSEVAGMTGSASGSNKGIAAPLLTSPYISPDPADVTAEEDEAFRKEVNRQAAEQEAKRRIAAGPVSGRGKSLSARSTGCDEIQNSKLGPKSANSSTRMDTSASSINSSSSATVGTSSIIWTKLASRVQAIHRQWDEARREARAAILRPMELHRESLKNSRVSMGNPDGSRPASSTPSQIRTHQILGVKPPISLMNKGSSWQERGGGDCPLESHWLDLQRVHQLQRDLIDFSEAAMELTHGPGFGRATPGSSSRGGVGVGRRSARSVRQHSWSQTQWDAADEVDPVADALDDSLSMASMPSLPSALHLGASDISTIAGDPLPLSRNQAAASDSIDRLRGTARTLVLHLAGMAPLAPLVLDTPFSSSMTGLEALIKESEAVAAGSGRASKSALLALQATADRARAEHQAIIKVLLANNAIQVKQSTVTAQVGALLGTFMGCSGKILKSSLADLAAPMDAAAKIAKALQKAEAARVNVPTSSSDTNNSLSHMSGGSACSRNRPLDAISRGLLGSDVAELVNVLRLHADDLETMHSSLRAVHATLQSEMRREIAALNAAKESLHDQAELISAEQSMGAKSKK